MGETMNTDRNAEIYRRQGSGETLAAIAREFGISRERVRQIQNQALDKLRQMLEQDKLLEDLPVGSGYEEDSTPPLAIKK